MSHTALKNSKKWIKIPQFCICNSNAVRLLTCLENQALIEQNNQHQRLPVATQFNLTVLNVSF